MAENMLCLSRRLAHGRCLSGPRLLLVLPPSERTGAGEGPKAEGGPRGLLTEKYRPG